MANVKWVGPGRSGVPLESGAFEDAANWSTDAVPDESSSVVLPGGLYTVTLATAAHVGRLAIGLDARFRLLDGASLDEDQALDMSGVLKLDGGVVSAGSLHADGASTISGFGTINGDATTDGRVVVHTGELEFTGDVDSSLMVRGKGTLALSGAENSLGKVHLSSLVLEGGHTEVHGSFRFDLLTLDDDAVFLDMFNKRRLSGDIVNNGTIVEDHGRLKLREDVSGTGVLEAHDGARLVFTSGSTVGAGQVVRLGEASVVGIKSPDDFAGSVSGFGRGDHIQVAGFSVDTRLIWVADEPGHGGTLNLSELGNKFAIHLIDGTYAQADFAARRSANGSLSIAVKGEHHVPFDAVAAFGDDAAALAPSHPAATDLHAPGPVMLV